MFIAMFTVEAFSQDIVEWKLDVPGHTVFRWRLKLGNVLKGFMYIYQRKIGGPNVVVEIDETVITRKRKYNRGRYSRVKQQLWLLPLNGTKKAFPYTALR